MWAGARIVFALLWASVHLIALAEGMYELRKCYCYEEMDDTLKQQLKALPTKEDIIPYEYQGIIPISSSKYSICSCKDVTRIKTPIVFKDDGVYNSVHTTGQMNELINKAKATFEELVKNRTATLSDKLSNTTVTFLSKDDSNNETNFEVEFLLKTEDVNLKTEVENALALEKDANDASLYIIPNVGKVKSQTKPEVVECDGNPEDIPENGKLNWESGRRIPGTVVTYECDDGYVRGEETISDESKCEHETLKWKETKFSCVPGCTEQPPEPKFFMMNKWKDEKRHIGAEILYYCMPDYRPKARKNHTSICRPNKKWSGLPKSFECENIECDRNKLPQAPAFGRTRGNNTVVRSLVTYYCAKGYSLTVKGNSSVECLSTGEWSKLPEGLSCNNTVSLLRTGFLEYYDYYNGMDLPDDNSRNYWILVTVPSLAGIAGFILLCLCITRTDRFLFMMCGWCRVQGSRKGRSRFVNEPNA